MLENSLMEPVRLQAKMCPLIKICFHSVSWSQETKISSHAFLVAI